MYQINVGLFSPYLLGQAGTQAGQQGVEEIEVWLPHLFQSKGPRQLVGSHGATYTPVLGISKEGGLATAALLQHRPLRQIAWNTGRTTPENYLQPEMRPTWS